MWANDCDGGKTCLHLQDQELWSNFMSDSQHQCQIEPYSFNHDDGSKMWPRYVRVTNWRCGLGLSGFVQYSVARCFEHGKEHFCFPNSREFVVHLATVSLSWISPFLAFPSYVVHVPYFMTTLVCHFSPPFCLACKRSLEWASTLVRWLSGQASQPTVAR
jgi:hypothetical protein